MVIVYMTKDAGPDTAKGAIQDQHCTEIRQMEKIGSSDQLKIVVIVAWPSQENGRKQDAYAEPMTCNGMAGMDDVGYYFVGVNSLTNFAPPDGSWNDGLGGGENALSNAIRHVVTYFDGTYFDVNNYILVLDGHGGGWKTTAYAGAVPIVPNDPSDLGAQIGSGFFGANNLVTVAFDSCLMQQIEVAYDIESSVQTKTGAMAGSEALGYVLPFDAILSQLRAFANINVANSDALATIFVNATADAAGNGEPVSDQALNLSIMRTGVTGSVTDAVNRLGHALIVAKQIPQARSDGEAHGFWDPPDPDDPDPGHRFDYFDLYGLTWWMSQNPEKKYDPSVVAAAKDLHALLALKANGGEIDAYRGTNPYDQPNEHWGGISIYIPSAKAQGRHFWDWRYDDTPFAAAAPCWACAVSTQANTKQCSPPCSIWCASCQY
jgi:hypothetical protein